MTFVWVATGGALGASLRYAVTLWIGAPLATFAVNIIGSFMMGLVFAWVLPRGTGSVAIFLMTGLLGGFTTFSAFSLDAWKLWQEGQPLWALGYAVLSPVLAIAAVASGIICMRWAML